MYLNSVAFTNFVPFAKGSRMNFAPVDDKPDDLAEVHLLTGENGTGKSRLLCLLAAALGDARSLQARCRKDDTAEFAVAWRTEDSQPVMTLRLGREGLSPIGNRSDAIFKEVRNTPAFARAGVSFVEDADLSKAISENAWTEGRLIFRPSVAYTESLLNKLQDIVVAARLGENDRLLALTDKLEAVLSEVMGKKFAFFPRNHPEKFMCVKLNGGPPLSMSQCPDGLRSLIGWLVDAALVMDGFTKSGSPVQQSKIDMPEKSDEVISADEARKQAEDELGAMIDGYFVEMERENWKEAGDVPSVILLDEIETHLHPGWQRQVLPAFQRMFPRAQIFVATHSPFVISSVNYGSVHILRRGENGVTAETHEAAKGDSYMTAVQEVLGLTGWFDAEVEKEMGDFELLLDKAYTSNGASESEMRSRAAHFMKPENRYSEEVRNMVTNLVAQYDLNRAAAKSSKA